MPFGLKAHPGFERIRRMPLWCMRDRFERQVSLYYCVGIKGCLAVGSGDRVFRTSVNTSTELWNTGRRLWMIRAPGNYALCSSPPVISKILSGESYALYLSRSNITCPKVPPHYLADNNSRVPRRYLLEPTVA